MLPVLFVSQLLAASAFAQSTTPVSEFDRTSGGSLDMITKHSAPLSGSLALSAAKSQLPLTSHLKGFDGTLGGTLVKDRVWFFASAQRNESLFATTQTASPVQTHMLDAKMLANVTQSQAMSTSFASTVPTSFLSLHYTAVISPSSFFTATVSQSKTKPTLAY